MKTYTIPIYNTTYKGTDMAMKSRNKTKKEIKELKELEARELAKRMQRSETTKVTIPFKGDELKLGTLRKVLAEQSDKFGDDAEVYIKDTYAERANGLWSSDRFYNEPRFTLTITSTKNID